MPVYSDMKYDLSIRNSGNVEVITDEDVILQSFKTIFATVTGERVRNPIGSKLVRILFEPLSQKTARRIERELKRVIELYEPRVRVKAINITPIMDLATYDVSINFVIHGLAASATFRNRLRALAVN